MAPEGERHRAGEDGRGAHGGASAGRPVADTREGDAADCSTHHTHPRVRREEEEEKKQLREQGWSPPAKTEEEKRTE